MRLSILIIAFHLTSCATTIDDNTKFANGVTYLHESSSLPVSCEELGSIIGRPTTAWWGGDIGNSQARVDAVNQAGTSGATHIFEEDANWIDGNVKVKAYRCR